MNALSPPEFLMLSDAVLRCWESDDAPSLLAAVMDSFDHLHPWVPWAAELPGLEEEEDFIGLAQQSWRDGDSFMYGGFDPADGAVLGCFGMHRALGPAALEIGYWLHSRHIGRGIATRAALALEEIAFSLPGIERVEIHCDEANVRSAAVPRRLGYHLAEIRQVEPEAPAQIGRKMIWVKAKTGF